MQKIVFLALLIVNSMSLIGEQCSISNKTKSKITVTIVYKPTVEKQTCVKKMFLVSSQSTQDIDVTQRGCTPYSFFATASDGSLAGQSTKFIANHPFLSAFTIHVTENVNNTLYIEVK